MRYFILIALLCINSYAKGSLQNAQTLLKEKKYQSAIDVLKQIKSKNAKEKTYVYEMLINGYISLKHYGKAVEYLEEMIALNTLSKGDLQKSRYNLFQLYMITKKSKKAIDFFEKYYKTKSMQTQIYANISLAYANEKEYKKALFYIQKAMKKDEKNAQYMQVLLYIYSASNNQKELCSSMESAYRLKILKSEYLLQLSYCLYKQGAVLRGANILSESLQKSLIKPTKQANELLFSLYLQSKEYENAKKIAYNLNDDRYTLMLVFALFDMGKYDEIVSIVKELKPKAKPLIYMVQAQSYYYLKDIKNAKKTFKKCLGYKNTKLMAKEWLKYLES